VSCSYLLGYRKFIRCELFDTQTTRDQLFAAKLLKLTLIEKIRNGELER
jgi:hypothetical protein